MIVDINSMVERLYQKSYEKIFQVYEVFKDYFDETGNVKLDDLYNAAKAAIAKSGQFTMYGLIFNEADIDKLYEYIKAGM